MAHVSMMVGLPVSSVHHCDAQDRSITSNSSFALPCTLPNRHRGSPSIIELLLHWTRAPTRTSLYLQETTPPSPTGENNRGASYGVEANKQIGGGRPRHRRLAENCCWSGGGRRALFFSAWGELAWEGVGVGRADLSHVPSNLS